MGNSNHQYGTCLNRVAPPVLPVIWVRPAAGSGEDQYISFCFRYAFAGANHQAGFSPWRAIGWFNTMATGKRQQTANCVQSFELHLLILYWRKWQQPPQTNVQSMIELGLAIARLCLNSILPNSISCYLQPLYLRNTFINVTFIKTSFAIFLDHI